MITAILVLCSLNLVAVAVLFILMAGKDTGKCERVVERIIEKSVEKPEAVHDVGERRTYLPRADIDEEYNERIRQK